MKREFRYWLVLRYWMPVFFSVLIVYDYWFNGFSITKHRFFEGEWYRLLFEWLGFAFGFLVVLFICTYKITVDDSGLYINSKVLAFSNEFVPWSNVKRIKYGVLFKELEYYSEKRKQMLSMPATGLNNHFVEFIMERLGQTTIEKG